MIGYFLLAICCYVVGFYVGARSGHQLGLFRAQKALSQFVQWLDWQDRTHLQNKFKEYADAVKAQTGAKDNK